jgi:hypothetical protein
MIQFKIFIILMFIINFYKNKIFFININSENYIFFFYSLNEILFIILVFIIRNNYFYELSKVYR